MRCAVSSGETGSGDATDVGDVFSEHHDYGNVVDDDNLDGHVFEDHHVHYRNHLRSDNVNTHDVGDEHHDDDHFGHHLRNDDNGHHLSDHHYGTVLFIDVHADLCQWCIQRCWGGQPSV